MDLQKIIDNLDLKVLTSPANFVNMVPSSGYTSDLLSCVMAGAGHGSIWVTLQAHMNIVAVASLLELTAVIITEDAQPDQATINKAEEEGITLLSTPQKSFEICGRLWSMGLRGT